jgi:hypothetical protein
MISNIYLVRTRNSVYEIQVSEKGTSRCRKGSGPWKTVKADSPEYLEKLAVGPGFLIPGVSDTSNVQDYQHFVPSQEPKRAVSRGLSAVTDHVVRQIRPQVVLTWRENDEDSYS